MLLPQMSLFYVFVGTCKRYKKDQHNLIPIPLSNVCATLVK